MGEIKELSKQTMDEHTMLYAMHCKLAYPLPCPKQIDVVRKVLVDKKNKNFLFNKMTYDTEVKLDGQVYKTIKLDTVKTPYQLTWNEPRTPFRMPSPMNMFGLPMWTVTVDHKAGKELVMKSNLADMELTIKRRPNIFVEFMKHKETLFLLDTKFNANVMKMNAPSILPMVFDDPRRHTFEVTVDHKPGQMLHIITNAPEMSSFKVTTNGVQRVLELN